MIVIQLIIIVAALAGIIFFRQRQRSDDRRRHQAEGDLILAKQRLTEATADLTHIETELFPLIDGQSERPYSDDIRNGVVTVGMPATFLTMAWGHPQRIQSSDAQQGVEYWFYKEQERQDAAPTEVMVQHQRVIKLNDF